MKLSTATMATIELVPYERNSKLHRDLNIDAIVASITRFGFNDPIGVTPEGIIVEGHGRWIAAQKLGLDEVPVLVIEGLEEKDYDLYRIAHNKIAQSSTFDFGALFANLQSIVGEGTDITFADMGFSEALIDNLHAHFASPEDRADAARTSMGADGTPYAYDIIWDSKEDKKLFQDFMDAEIAAGAHKCMGAEVLMSALERMAPEMYAKAKAAHPGDVSLDSIPGSNEEEHAHVFN